MPSLDRLSREYENKGLQVLLINMKEESSAVAAFMKNITDEIHNQATTNVGGLVEFRVPNIRRHWGIELAYNW